MRRYLITCDCCGNDIGFDSGDGSLRWGKLEYKDGRKRDLCDKCFADFAVIFANAKADNEACRRQEK